MKMNLCLLPGDGIGPEVIMQARKVIKAIAKRFDHDVQFEEGFIGGSAIDINGHPLPEETIQKCNSADAVVLGAIGGPKWDGLGHDKKPEKGLLGIRKELKLFANLRPAFILKPLKQASYLREDIVEDGVNLLVVRELTGGIYYGEPRGIHKELKQRVAINTMKYDENEIRQIAEVAFQIAQQRKKNLCSVDKANILEVSHLWREIVNEVSQEFRDVKLSHMYVDNAAMQLVRDPRQFDVIVTSNLFGDIISDEAAIITGSIGMLPSASLRKDKKGIYEPVHGSAPDIAGKNIANPLGSILSVMMMFEYTFNLETEAKVIKDSIEYVLSKGYRTKDILQKNTTVIGCEEMGNKIVNRIMEIPIQ